MHVLRVGFNYKTTPLETRETFTFSEDHLSQAVKQLAAEKSILENVIISTCNRTEIYVVADQLHTGRYYVKRFLSEWFEVPIEDFALYLQISENEAATQHLFKVVSGLDSMVLGETQILGQIRDAFLAAQKAQTTGTIFNELFKRALTFAKRAHHETGIGAQAVSISYAAVELAKKIFGDLKKKHVAIVGAGEMGELSAKNLLGAGVGQMTVVNRSLENAEALAKTFGASSATFDHLPSVLKQADIVISSTGSQEPIITKEMIAPVQMKRKGAPLFLVDIAVPRDIEAEAGQAENVFLYDIDDLQHIVDDNLASRQAAAAKIEHMIDGELVLFEEWIQMLGVVPVITALREKGLAIQAATMESIERKMPDLTAREKKVLQKHTKSIVNQMLKEPIKQAKEMSACTKREEALNLFIDIFGIENEVRTILDKQNYKESETLNSNGGSHISFPFLKHLPSK
ncbi:Glutamyl-tRNA reductase [Lentibacillus sp. JNUCC-1]|uniref:glutamyl-tRNA reductase n=1 Tax=Lentibacillus sp. JNUCC-1 TaxID=2654513 RepID=UPI00132522CB|nr:Glutamyl-tRNA reductase [Lentibacillus sp. JNUCC-1]